MDEGMIGLVLFLFFAILLAIALSRSERKAGGGLPSGGRMGASDRRCRSNVDGMEKRKDVAGLIKALNHNDVLVRRLAADALLRLGGDDALDALAGRVKEPDLSMYAVLAVRRLGGQRAVEGLATALEDKDYEVRRQAVFGLKAIGGTDTIQPLIRALRDADNAVAMAADDALVQMGEIALEPLLAAVKAGVFRTRSWSADVIGSIADKKAIPQLVEMLKEGSAPVRFQAAYALRHIAQWRRELKGCFDETAIETLIDALGDKAVKVRRQAAWAQGAIGDPRAIPALIKAVSDEDGRVRQGAAFALTRAPLSKDQDTAAEVMSTLLRCLEDSDGKMRQYGVSALFHLARTGDKEEALRRLVELLDDRSEAVRRSSVWELCGLAYQGDDAALQLIIRALRHRRDDVRLEAAHELRLMTCEPAIDALIEALLDASSEVRTMAAASLFVIGAEVPRAEKAYLRAVKERLVPSHPTIRAALAERLRASWNVGARRGRSEED